MGLILRGCPVPVEGVYLRCDSLLFRARIDGRRGTGVYSLLGNAPESKYNRSISHMNQEPTFVQEQELWQQGYRCIAGIDEVGRGPLAGPVVAAAVILSLENRPSWLFQVRDSKKLSPRKREFLSECIRREALAVGIGEVSAETIDEEGIVAATKMAMRSAVRELAVPADFLLIDALVLSEVDIPQKGIIRGDNISFSIAAASIVAKVYRDRIMHDYDSLYPGYSFARNKGYPTAEHIQGLRQLGCCPVHRRSFAPVRGIEEDER
ncbi:MAG: ribonuclease HII [Dehalococcoidia bacterium]|nr:ribonuclease HII [Dehalococcoidia bacterium]